jgi:hypothetical protein
MKTKYPRSYHFSYSLGAKNDDRINNDVSTLLGTDIIISEKIDGSNTAFSNVAVFGRSHVEPTRNSWDVKMWELHNRIKSSIDEDMYIFGENMYGIHSIEYSELTSYFYMFGVRYKDIWLSWDEVEEISYLLDIPTVPVLFKGMTTVDKILEGMVKDFASQPSSLGGIREGVVVRLRNSFHDDDFSNSLLKYVRKDHVQTSDTHWTRDWKKATIKY